MANENFSNPREKFPETLRNMVNMQVANYVSTGDEVKTDLITAPGAGLCIYIWGVMFTSNNASQDAVGIGDGVMTPIGVAATKYASMNLTFATPVKCGTNLGLDVLDSFSHSADVVKLTQVFYQIAPA